VMGQILRFPAAGTPVTDGCPRTRRSCRLLSAALLLLAGCGDNRVAVPPVSPEEAGKQAIAKYDQNHDGQLDADELERCPALKGSLKLIDKNHDGKLSAQEISDRIATVQATRVGLLAFACQVQLDDKALADATVTFVPESFLGDAIKPASAVTDARGFANL